ncbi:hypothetical protein MARCHEWKA_03060 [Brevundimonas phage vB_BpoS-Marchewka]|uniref:Uncharacterized protein n=1 Tax=Brevundimonas phage vB_BpoS-Marchewka TaxID=2948604 RepID=A0A9E7SQX2_9CAUD|nr:hypothetical protein MARCHEWKA_03060 [Brevundimonas phage vB_BpoS-Marchewka]UTC29265.1 hypothetical protein BAMBUS_01830 [Brevundimonas phage vB_BpoS-Bambus]
MSIQDRMNLVTPMVNVRLSPAVDQVAIARDLAGRFDQNQHDYDAMTTIAAHLREHPAAPLSGRQCSEFVQDARDRLYGGVTTWNRLVDRAPCAVAQQADVLFCGRDWATPLSGMVTRWGTPEEWRAAVGSIDHHPGHEYEWSWYRADTDQLIPWDGPAPTLWLLLPKTPGAQEHPDAD